VQSIKDPVSVFWFRRDLRITDNHGLYEALKKGTPVLPVFIYDTLILDNLTDKKDRRVGFIHQSLNDLNEELKKNGSSLYILHSTPLEAFKHLCNAFQITEVITNHDYEPYAIERDAGIKDFLSEKNIPFHTFKDQVIFDKSEVVKGDGTSYTMYAPYSRVWKKQYAEQGPVTYPSEQFLGNVVKADPFPFPSLKEIGFEEIEKLVPYTLNEETVLNYHKTRDHPGTAGTSQVSVHLRFGTVSIRHLIQLASSLNEKWLNELIWREFFMMILYHFPSVVKQSFKKKFDNIEWRNNKQEFELWCRERQATHL
jgi:deoxyribodipyrimidine photo-lyase